MKKNRKKVVFLIGTLVVVAIISLLIYFVSNLSDENSFTLSENKWIDSNKHNVVDVALLNDIPILSYDGDGLVYDYLDFVTKEHSIKFNVITYKLDGTAEYNYKMQIVDLPSNNDIVLLKDNMVLITNNNLEFSDLKDINSLKLGTLASDVGLLSSYFKDSNIQFIGYNTYSELKSVFTDNKTNLENNTDVVSLDGIIILKTVFTKEMIENNYNISYQFNDLNKYFVLSANGQVELNSILNKSYNIWEKENYNDYYNKSLLKNYFNFKNVSDVEQKKLQSKSYVYGFIDYGIYNYLDNNKISGLSGLVLKGFNNFSGISITYTRYNSINKLLKDFNAKKVDFVLNNINDNAYFTDVYKTVGLFDKNLAIISGINNKQVINGINSLKDKTVLIVKDTFLEQYLMNNGVKVKSYNNLKDLSDDFDVNDITILDLENYNFYKSSSFKDSKINSLLNIDSKYNYLINNTNDNKNFKDLFNFYITFESIDELVYSNYDKIAYNNVNVVYILLLIIIILFMYVILDFSNHFKIMLKTLKKNKKLHLSKEEKIKYIDQLTSLKNRAYLNSKIEIWDDSEVYPQSIIVIDLNNISYINDNYGREEGDKVITEAANILIQNQLQNSEIIRTDGNEFLIYLVGYSEKQIVSYLRKLNKELKGLSHGFGAASGYSIINDAIKTVDDAVNEATLDMKNNKEDIDY